MTDEDHLTVKCLLLSTFEQSGGAARSAHRLFQKLGQMDVDCRMLVQYKQSVDPMVFGTEGWLAQKIGVLRPYLDALPLLCYRTCLSPPWSLAWLPKNIDAQVSACNPDIIHLHGVGHGFLPIAAIRRFTRPLVWTLHDSWAFTGGCHLPGTCERYLDDCGQCPQLNARHEYDLSLWGWHRKANCWPNLEVTFVAPSRWLAKCARSSSLLNSKPIEVIPNGIDTGVFAPGDRTSARASLGLPHEGIVLLYGASAFTCDENKGFALLDSALTGLSSSLQQKKIILAVFGDPHFQQSEVAGIPVRTYGTISSDEELVSLYRAADLFVLPSLQENLPNTVMEAMACGIPCVAFNVGGVSDLIESGVNGYLATAADVYELADGITWMLADDDRCTNLGYLARKTIEDGFSLIEVAERYLDLYCRVLDGSLENVARAIVR